MSLKPRDFHNPSIGYEDPHTMKLLTLRCARIPEDELINVISTRVTDGIEETFKIKTSSLMRSPLFYSFFKSEAYLHGCKLQLNFETHPAECFEIVHHYLDQGPDRYTKQSIRFHITFSYSMIYRFVILIKLYALAGDLGLSVLKNLAYECIEEAKGLVQATFCIYLANLIYGKKAGFDKRLKRWCFNQVSLHFRTLQKSEEWAEGIEELDPELGAKWRDLLETNESFEMAAQQGAAETAATAAAAAPPAVPGTSERRKAREQWKRSAENLKDLGGMASSHSPLLTSNRAHDVLGMGKRAKSRPTKTGESSATSTTTKSRPWPFSKGKDENKSMEQFEDRSEARTRTKSEVEVRTPTAADEAVPQLRPRKSRFFKMFGSSERQV